MNGGLIIVTFQKAHLRRHAFLKLENCMQTKKMVSCYELFYLPLPHQSFPDGEPRRAKGSHGNREG